MRLTAPVSCSWRSFGFRLSAFGYPLAAATPAPPSWPSNKAGPSNPGHRFLLASSILQDGSGFHLATALGPHFACVWCVCVREFFHPPNVLEPNPILSFCRLNASASELGLFVWSHFDTMVRKTNRQPLSGHPPPPPLGSKQSMPLTRAHLLRGRLVSISFPV